MWGGSFTVTGHAKALRGASREEAPSCGVAVTLRRRVEEIPKMSAKHLKATRSVAVQRRGESCVWVRTARSFSLWKGTRRMSLKKGLGFFFFKTLRSRQRCFSLTFISPPPPAWCDFCVKIIIANVEAWVPWAVKRRIDQHIRYHFQCVSFTSLWTHPPPPPQKKVSHPTATMFGLDYLV